MIEPQQQNLVLIEKEAIEREIADLEKKLATKKALLPGLIHLAKQLNGASSIDQSENSPRLRLGEYPRMILAHLYSSPLGFDLVESLPKILSLDTGQVKSGVRNLLNRGLVTRNGAHVYLSDSGKEFYKKYQEKQ